MRTTTLRIMERILAEVIKLERINMAFIANKRWSAAACEVIARRVIHEAPPEKITIMLSTRFRHQELDGHVSEKANALEVAIDSHW